MTVSGIQYMHGLNPWVCEKFVEALKYSAAELRGGGLRPRKVRIVYTDQFRLRIDCYGATVHLRYGAGANESDARCLLVHAGALSSL
jgi:hypothetical protein